MSAAGLVREGALSPTSRLTVLVLRHHEHSIALARASFADSTDGRTARGCGQLQAPALKAAVSVNRRRRAALAESPSCIPLGGLRARRSPRTVSESDDGIRRDAARLASGLGQRARRSLLAQATVCPETALSAPPWASDTLVYRRFMLQPRVWRYMRIMPGSSQQARLAPLVLANDGLAGVASCSLSDDRRNRQGPRDIGGGMVGQAPSNHRQRGARCFRW